MVPKFILKNARLCAKMIQQGRKNVAYKIPLICSTFRNFTTVTYATYAP